MRRRRCVGCSEIECPGAHWYCDECGPDPAPPTPDPPPAPWLGRNSKTDEHIVGTEDEKKDVESIGKTELVVALETKNVVKSDCKKIVANLAEVAAKQVKKGKFIIRGVVMIKTRLKRATKVEKIDASELVIPV